MARAWASTEWRSGGSLIAQVPADCGGVIRVGQDPMAVVAPALIPTERLSGSQGRLDCELDSLTAQCVHREGGISDGHPPWTRGDGRRIAARWPGLARADSANGANLVESRIPNGLLGDCRQWRASVFHGGLAKHDAGVEGAVRAWQEIPPAVGKPLDQHGSVKHVPRAVDGDLEGNRDLVRNGPAREPRWSISPRSQHDVRRFYLDLRSTRFGNRELPRPSTAPQRHDPRGLPDLSAARGGPIAYRRIEWSSIHGRPTAPCIRKE